MMQETRTCKQKKKLQVNIVNVLRKIRKSVDKNSIHYRYCMLGTEKNTYKEAYEEKSLRY